jgi:hypothetical protein
MTATVGQQLEWSREAGLVGSVLPISQIIRAELSGNHAFQLR